MFAVNNKIEAADAQRAKNMDACTDSADKIKIQRFFIYLSHHDLFTWEQKKGRG
jgi:hypothetical protein